MMIITRRSLMLAGLGTLATSRVKPALAGNPGGVRVGAIRWDAWYGATVPGSSEYQANHNLDPADLQYRAPFFAKQAGANLMYINGQQTDMDAELVYASNAGLKYWAFDWYAAGRPLRNAWNYYQASPNKALVNWCVLCGYNSLNTALPGVAELVGYFQQTTYEKFGTRPMLYLLADGGSTATLTATLTALRAACTSAGVSSPYVVMMSGTPSAAAADMVTVGADCISTYAHAVAGPVAYTAMDTNVQAFWATMTATAKPVIPLGMVGWDRSPRIRRPSTFEPVARPYLATNNIVSPGTAAQIASHIAALVAFVTANAASCPSNKAIVYSWNELDEGGNGLCPTWTAGGPDNSRLMALSAVLQ